MRFRVIGILLLLAAAMGCARDERRGGPQPGSSTSPSAAHLGAKAKLRDVTIDGQLDAALNALELAPGVKKKWIRRDARVLTLVASAFPLTSVEDTVGMLDIHGNSCVPRELGFGVVMRHCNIGGGYTKCSLQLLSYDGQIMQSTTFCQSSEEKWNAIEPAVDLIFRQTLKPKGFSQKENKSTLAKANKAVVTAARANVAQALGQASGAQVPEPLRAPYDVLTSPKKRNEVGDNCGLSLKPTDGHRAMRSLVDAKRADLLRDALRGLNPEGRLYGYIGLQILKVNTPDDDATYNKIAALPIPIDTCGGCTSGTETAATLDLSIFLKKSRWATDGTR